MSIFYLIVKILLYILLAIVILFLIFIILPLRYVLKADYKDSRLNADFKYTFFYFDFFVDMKDMKNVKYKARIFGKVIADSDKKNKEKFAKDDEGESLEGDSFFKNKNLSKEINTSDEVFLNLFKRSKKYDEEIRKNDPIEVKSEKKLKKEESEKKELKDRINDFINNFKKILPLNMIDLAKLISYEVVNYGANILPDKVDIKAKVGLSEPANTGLLLSFFAPLYALYGDTIDISSDFTKESLSGGIELMGKPRIIFMIIPVIHLFLNKRFREIVLSKH